MYQVQTSCLDTPLLSEMSQCMEASLCVQVSARQAVVETLERVFARHGAVPMDSNTIGFCPVDAPADTAELLSTTGARLAVRCCFHASYTVPAAFTDRQKPSARLLEAIFSLRFGRHSYWKPAQLMWHVACADMSCGPLSLPGLRGRLQPRPTTQPFWRACADTR